MRLRVLPGTAVRRGPGRPPLTRGAGHQSGLRRCTVVGDRTEAKGLPGQSPGLGHGAQNTKWGLGTTVRFWGTTGGGGGKTQPWRKLNGGPGAHRGRIKRETLIVDQSVLGRGGGETPTNRGGRRFSCTSAKLFPVPRVGHGGAASTTPTIGMRADTAPCRQGFALRTGGGTRSGSGHDAGGRRGMKEEKGAAGGPCGGHRTGRDQGGLGPLWPPV